MKRLILMLALAMVLAVTMAMSAVPAFAQDDDQGEDCGSTLPETSPLCLLEQGDQDQQ